MADRTLLHRTGIQRPMPGGTQIYARPIGLPWLLLLLMLFPPRNATAGENIHPFNIPPGPPPLEVQVRFFLSDIDEINEQTETFEIKGVIYLKWKDERQAFDPDTDGVSEKLYQGPFQFLEEYNSWWPLLILANGVGTLDQHAVSLRVSPDGTMLYMQEISAVVESPMNLRRYPFDRQQLKAVFEPLGHDASELKLVTKPDMVDLPDRPVRVAGWELLDLNAGARVDHDPKTGAKYSQFLLALDMQRLPAYAIWFIIVPMSLIVLLSTSIFWMDRESLGSRMDISFIGLLTIVAYQAIAVSNLPQIAYFTLIDGLIFGAYGTMTLCIVSNIYVDTLNRRGAVEAADRFDRIGRWAVPLGFLIVNLISGLYFYHV